MPAEAVSDLLDEYAVVIHELDRARTAYTEACAQEVVHRAATLRARLEAGEPVTSTSHWADIDSSTWVAEKLRRRSQMDALVDRRNLIRDTLSLHRSPVFPPADD